ncbi:MAG: hypothetical protein G01um101425_768 [Candidatus Peregrinibacteria bacterium Gr01-1014_25]|nr:MAG: hypothetical protein G01um101425_768 [Candidatus Peregrinibacteria bacterium Gr01-1014_25]
MFGHKKDRHVVELIVQFNLTAIDTWLHDGAKIENIEVGKKWQTEDIIKSYFVDILPSGNNSLIFFHRESKKFANSLAASDWINIEDLMKVKSSSKSHGKKNEIQGFEWEFWHDFICTYVHVNGTRAYLLAAPFDEIYRLHTVGELETKKFEGDSNVIEVPSRWDEKGGYDYKNSLKIQRRCNQRSVGYSNSLACVSANVSNSQVLYCDPLAQ